MNSNNYNDNDFYAYGQDRGANASVEGERDAITRDNGSAGTNSYSSQGSQNDPSSSNTQTVYGSQNTYSGQTNVAGQQAGAGSGQTNVAGQQASAGSGQTNVAGQQAGAGSGQAETGGYNAGYGVRQGSCGYNGAYQQNNGYQGNAYQSGSGQGNIYQGNAYQSGSGQGNIYQGSNSYQNLNQASDGGTGKKKREKKQGFGVKVAKCAALALVFGTVSGTVFEGIHYLGGRIAGEPTASIAEGSDSVLSTVDPDKKVQKMATASNYVATDVSDIVDATMPSIVAITNVSRIEYPSFWGGMPQAYENTSCGSGIIVSQDNNYLYIVTNNHVVNGASSLTVTFNNDSTVSAEVKGTDPSTDLAVIKVALGSIDSDTMNAIKVATMGSSDELRVGEAAVAIGNALGYGQSVTTGCISALNREVSISDNETSYTAELLQTDAAINPGNSGGALLNAAGEVIGINSVKYSDTDVEGIGYAIPISTAMPIIEDLITKEKVDESESAYLGVRGVDVTSDVANTYSMPSGVFVAQIIPGSGAELAGIQKGDIITKFDGRTIESMDALSATIEYYKAGTTVDVTILRASNGEYVEQVLPVTLGKKN